MAGKRKKKLSEEDRRYREEAEQRHRRYYAELGFRNLPPIGGEQASPEEYRAFRAEANERRRQIEEHLRRVAGELEARRRAGQP